MARVTEFEYNYTITVNQLIEKLQKLKEQGYGNHKVFIDSQLFVTELDVHKIEIECDNDIVRNTTVITI